MPVGHNIKLLVLSALGQTSVMLGHSGFDRWRSVFQWLHLTSHGYPGFSDDSSSLIQNRSVICFFPVIIIGGLGNVRTKQLIKCFKPLQRARFWI